MADNTLAQKKLISFLKKRHPSLSEKELVETLTGLKRFVNVVRKIYTEPQAQIKIIDKKKIVSTDLEEFKKVLGRNKSMPLEEAFKSLNSAVEKDKYGR